MTGHGLLTEKVGKLEFPDALLKRIMRLNNPDKEESFVEDNYDKSIEELTWHLIKEQLVKANDIKVEQEDITNMAKTVCSSVCGAIKANCLATT